MTLLTFDDLSLDFGEQIILKSASFSLLEGERVCLIGRNGAGKSTLLRIVAGEQQFDRGEMKIFFQPVVRLEDRTIAGFEAVLRWDHPRFGRLSPSDFIPIAEETGLILDLTLFALERTSRELAAWQRAIDVSPPIFASVNVSSRQLLRHELLHDVKGVITRAGVSRGSLKLKMTEALVMENPEYSAQILQRVREVGAGLILDDFGAGYSSLAYLQRLPFDMIRIGRNFVRHDATGVRPVILRSLVALARDLGMEVIAEGTETESDTIELYQLGCEFAQGYAFGRPISSADARKCSSCDVCQQLDS
jgi:EAL domain-containing protein (putative c-di-GMP-specific phosphodiesterase class I)